MERQDNGIDLRAVRNLYRSNPGAKAALDHFAGRQYNSSETTVDRLLAVLRQSGASLGRGDAIDILKALAAARCGQFLIGRKGHPSRLEWSVSLISVGQAASGETSEVEKLSESEVEVRNDDGSSGEPVEHRFVLRPDFEVRVSLPADLTQVEASRLADFVKTLPFGS